MRINCLHTHAKTPPEVICEGNMRSEGMLSRVRLLNMVPRYSFESEPDREKTILFLCSHNSKKTAECCLLKNRFHSPSSQTDNRIGILCCTSSSGAKYET